VHGRRISILGSTGSIGLNALEVIRKLGRFSGGGFRVWGLAAQRNVPLLKKQVLEFEPRAVVVYEADAAAEMLAWARRRRLRLSVWQGVEGLERLARAPETDFLLSSVVGAVGLLPLLSAVRAGKRIALANKEALIVAGDLLMESARRSGAEIIPVDSEHSAIFQCLQGYAAGRRSQNGESPREIRRLILTASGGAFYRRKGSLDGVSVAEALSHPTWKMGNKITIDSATLTNKGLEAIEAHHLFGVPLEKIGIVIHPQSIIHSLVEFTDGAMLAQLSHPDMRLPIQYALTHPARYPSLVRPLRLEEIQKLEFYPPDFRRFPCLSLALTAGRRGGTWPAVFNGANEAAVRSFLDGRISFGGVPRVIGKVMRAFAAEPGLTRNGMRRPPSLADILAADAWARKKSACLCEKERKTCRS